MYSKTNPSELHKVISWTLPKLHCGKINYIQFSAYDPCSGKLRTKRIKVNRIKKKSELKKYANELIGRLVVKLSTGWSPWTEERAGASMAEFTTVCEKFTKMQSKLYDDKIITKQSFSTFNKYIKSICNYNSKLIQPIKYIYEFDKTYISNMLDFLYLEKGVSARTRNNYRDFIQKFCSFCVEKNYLEVRPDEQIKKINIKKKDKTRTIIPEDELQRIFNFIEQCNKHYLLECYIIYYCFIRPNEMSYVKIKDINLKEQTIYISSEISKNRSSGKVTLPAKVIHLMLELNIFSCSVDHYLFSKDFAPGQTKYSETRFRKYWIDIRKILRFSEEYKFYSLKDTGITQMLVDGVTPISVRDQARHHSLEMTNIYTPDSNLSAPEELKNYK